MVRVGRVGINHVRPIMTLTLTLTLAITSTLTRARTLTLSLTLTKQVGHVQPQTLRFMCSLRRCHLMSSNRFQLYITTHQPVGRATAPRSLARRPLHIFHLVGGWVVDGPARWGALVCVGGGGKGQVEVATIP